MATVFTEGVRNAEFIISEANHTRSREEVTVTVGIGAVLRAGTILGALTSGGKYIARVQGAGDGSQNAKGILYATQDNSQGAAPVDVQATIIARDAEVVGEQIDANDGVDATVRAELLALGIIVRGSIGNVA